MKIERNENEKYVTIFLFFYRTIHLYRYNILNIYIFDCMLWCRIVDFKKGI